VSTRSIIISNKLNRGDFTHLGEALKALRVATEDELIACTNKDNLPYWQESIERIEKALEIYDPLWQDELKRRETARLEIAHILRAAGFVEYSHYLAKNDYRELAI